MIIVQSGFTIAELEDVAGACGWIDVCRKFCYKAEKNRQEKT